MKAVRFFHGQWVGSQVRPGRASQEPNRRVVGPRDRGATATRLEADGRSRERCGHTWDLWHVVQMRSLGRRTDKGGEPLVHLVHGGMPVAMGQVGARGICCDERRCFLR